MAGHTAEGSADPYSQAGFSIRFDWGLQGAIAISAGAAAVVVVDVLSFTTTLSVALDAGIEVFPYRFRDCLRSGLRSHPWCGARRRSP